GATTTSTGSSTSSTGGNTSGGGSTTGTTGNSSTGGEEDNRGTVKIVSGTDNEDDQDEDSRVCTFHIYGFGFHTDAHGTWKIVAWTPTGDNETGVASGTWSANSTGKWDSAEMKLPAGQYKSSAA